MTNLFPVYWSRTPLLLTDFAFCFFQISNCSMRSTVAGLYSKVNHLSNWEVDFEMIISTKTRVFGSRANVNTKSTKEQIC